ncbi:putative disease resistance protein At1g58390 [Carex rostrata]
MKEIEEASAGRTVDRNSVELDLRLSDGLNWIAQPYFQTEMDALPFIKGILSQPSLKVLLSDNFPDKEDLEHLQSREIVSILMKIKFDLMDDPEGNKVDLIKRMQLEARQIGRSSREKIPSLRIHNVAIYWKKRIYYNINDIVSCKYLKQTEAEGESEHTDIDVLISSLNGIKIIEGLLPHIADNSSNIFANEERNRALFLITAFPKHRELKEPSKILEFLLELTKELDNLPQLIGKACEGDPLALVLIGGLLSFKKMDYDTWNKVKDDLLAEIKESDNDAPNNRLLHVINYCYKDLPDIIKKCFLYLACYPIDYEIPARSLTEIWIAEGFVTPEEGQTAEETANNYLQQLVQRSLVCVSKRSILGAIKCCRVGQSIHKYAIDQSYKEEFLAANKDLKQIKSMSRVAINHDNKKENPILVLDRGVVSFLAFDIKKNNVKMSDMLWVLELRNSAMPKAPLISMSYLRYLGLRGSKITELPPTIMLMKFLQTLDVRDTIIKTLPESLWTITTLLHVYADPSSEIKGPPSTTTISDLQILKTVAVPESWLENFPQGLINLRKLAISNMDNPKLKPNPYWKSISNLMSQMVNLISMAIIGDIVPSELVDLRAFPKLETVRTIKLVGEWNCRKLIIDNVKFPTNLTKLTLTKSGLVEDPMPRLEKLEALKYLSLQDGAYLGEKMVCSANGFPQLQSLQLLKLENLQTWEMKSMAMSHLTTLHVVNCCKLKNLPDLKNVTELVNCCTLKNLPDLNHVTELVNYCKLENHKCNAVSVS